MTVYELVERWIPCLCNDHYTVFIVFDNDYRSEQKPPITMHKNEWLNCPQDENTLKAFKQIQKKMKAAYDKGDIKALDELTEEVIFL